MVEMWLLLCAGTARAPPTAWCRAGYFGLRRVQVEISARAFEKHCISAADLRDKQPFETLGSEPCRARRRVVDESSDSDDNTGGSLAPASAPAPPSWAQVLEDASSEAFRQQMQEECAGAEEAFEDDWQDMYAHFE